MSGWKNKTKTFRYTHPDWETTTDPETGKEIKSYWIFRTDISDDDRDTIRQMATRTVMTDIPEKERRQALKNGTIDKLIAEHMHEEVLMSTRRATLVVLGKGWEGPEFVLPEDYTVEDAVGNETPHPLAGQPVPYTAEFIGLRDPDQVDDMMFVLNQIWAGRSPEEEKQFPASDRGLHLARIPERGEGEDPVSAATDEVLRTPGTPELQSV